MKLDLLSSQSSIAMAQVKNPLLWSGIYTMCVHVHVYVACASMLFTYVYKRNGLETFAISVVS